MNIPTSKTIKKLDNFPEELSNLTFLNIKGLSNFYNNSLEESKYL